MNYLVLQILLLITTGLQAPEKFFTKTGTIRFDATANASLEKVSAINRSVSAVFDSKSGQLLFVVQMKGFEFEKALMQEHFNENYIESDKYPKADFKGQITNFADLDLGKDGTSRVSVKGTLTLHGQSRTVDAAGTLELQNGHILLHSVFNIKLKDYSISIPGLVADKIAKSAAVTVDCTLDPFITH